EFVCQCRQPVVLTVRPAKLDRHVLTCDEAAFAQTAAERSDEVRRVLGRPGTHEADYRRCRLLRARHERPSGYTAAEKCDEFPPPHGAYPKAKDHGRTIAGLGVGRWRASQ